MPRAMFLLLSRCLHCLGEKAVQKNWTTMATGYFYNSLCAEMELCVKLTSLQQPSLLNGFTTATTTLLPRLPSRRH